MPPGDNDVNAKPLTPEELGWCVCGSIRSTGAVRGAVVPQGLAFAPFPNLTGLQFRFTADGQYLVASRANQLFLYHVPTGRR